MNTTATVDTTANTTVNTVMENNTNTPKQIPYSIQNLLQIPQEQLTAAFPQNMVGFKSAYDKNNNFIPLKFIKALNKKLNIQTQWPVLDIKEKDQLYDEGYGFNFTYLTNEDKILVTYDMFIIMQQLVHYDFKPYISVEMQQNLFIKYHTINWQINQNPPPPVVRPKTKKQTTKRQTTTKTTTTKTQKQKVQNNENVQGQADEDNNVQGQVDEVKNVQTKKTQSKKVQPKKEQDTNVDEQPKPKRRTTKKQQPQDILEQLNQNVGNNTAPQNQPSQNVDQQNIEQQNIIHEFENTIKQCETTQNDEPTTTDNINNLLTTTDQDNDLTEEELKTTANMDNLLDFDAL